MGQQNEAGFFVRHEGSVTGPMTKKEVLAALQGGSLTPAAQVYREGSEGWHPIMEVLGGAAAGSAPAPDVVPAPVSIPAPKGPQEEGWAPVSTGLKVAVGLSLFFCVGFIAQVPPIGLLVVPAVLALSIWQVKGLSPASHIIRVFADKTPPHARLWDAAFVCALAIFTVGAFGAQAERAHKAEELKLATQEARAYGGQIGALVGPPCALIVRVTAAHDVMLRPLAGHVARSEMSLGRSTLEKKAFTEARVHLTRALVLIDKAPREERARLRVMHDALIHTLDQTEEREAAAERAFALTTQRARLHRDILDRARAIDLARCGDPRYAKELGETRSAKLAEVQRLGGPNAPETKRFEASLTTFMPKFELCLGRIQHTKRVFGGR